ncbi:GNAT family N-acetyltransferase [Kiloniella sp.]|uniref:GNAT family N-acetyltransferase n=1 Tax=Kiloniella sp. TaxID=1938587 RepID=UPI003A8F872E
MFEFRKFTPCDKGELLALIERSDSTPRTDATWDGNPMTACLAFESGRLIGAVPFEKRTFKITNEHHTQMLWVSAAHVDPPYRSQGIGQQLLDNTISLFGKNFDSFGVYREDESSKAYKWYEKNNFIPLLPILAYKKKIDGFTPLNPTNDWVQITSDQDLKFYEEDLFSCLNNSMICGIPKRNPEHWRKLFSSYYYKDFNELSILATRSDTNITSFAVLARTSMRDNIDRLDILELVAAEHAQISSLVSLIEGYAHKIKVNEVRIQCSAQDQLRYWIEENGYRYRNRRTNIMGRVFNIQNYLNKISKLPGNLPKSEAKDTLSIETPDQGIFQIGEPSIDTPRCFIRSNDLQTLLFQRSSPADMITDGRIILLESPERSKKILCNLFPLASWRYFQSDYI